MLHAPLSSLIYHVIIRYSRSISPDNMVKSSEWRDRMPNGTITKLKIPALKEFDFQIKYSELNRKTHTHEIDFHTHNELELYINLSGDVSFLVDRSLYELTRGDVIIARPGERHHCVYRSDAPHKLFWILFDCRKNEELLDILHENFSENYIRPQNDLREELLGLCNELHSGSLTNEERIYNFLRIFAILKKSKNAAAPQQSKLPQELRIILDYIDSHICEELSVKGIAKALFISQSTLERKFRENLDVTPLEYIRRKKLFIATQKLQEGKTVLEAGTSVGYNDNSYFIELFKQIYGITPYQYQKRHKP